MIDWKQYTRFTLPTTGLLGLAIVVFAIVGCDSLGSESSTGDNVEIGFSTSHSSSKAAAHSTSNQSTSKSAARLKATSDSLVLTGSNGELKITDVRLIVSEFEIEGEADSTEFEAEPSFLDLPLDTSEVAPVVASQLPTGIYNELEFEVEDVDLDEAEEDEDEDEEDLRTLRNQIQEEFPNWPASASMVVVGTFTPEGDTTRSFTTYFEAEIEVEHQLSPPLEVTGVALSRTLTVRLDPAQWFANSDGTVWNLASNDYESTGELVEFEAEFEDGVAEIDSDDDGDDDGDDD